MKIFSEVFLEQKRNFEVIWPHVEFRVGKSLTKGNFEVASTEKEIA